MIPSSDNNGDQKGSEFTPRTDDIYIVTYPRSGTTWLQMILYQLTTSGSMDFTHISEYIPYLDRAISRGRDLDYLQSPRILKTHWQLSRIRRWPGKCIYVARDGKDVLYSYFKFYKDFLNFNKPFDEFFSMFLSGTVQYGTWFKHIVDAGAFAQDPDVLFLNYEYLVGNFPAGLKQIVSFLDLEITPEKFDEVLHRSSFAFMREHESKFDHTVERLWEKTQEIAAGSFLRQGKVGGGDKQLTPEQALLFEQKELEMGIAFVRQSSAV